MRNYKMILSYDGSNYKGWQRLANEPLTIQGIIEKAISNRVGYDVTIDGSGRTDAGVHAKGQVANVKLSGLVELEEFQKDLNDLLPKDIQINAVELVKNGFHSRLNAKGKFYSYSIDLREKPCVFTRKYTYHFGQNIDIERMKQASTYLVGTHDFSAFCDKKDEKSAIRTIHGINFVMKRDQLILEYFGNGFLNHMVRIVTGTLLEVGSNQKEVNQVKSILESRVRANAGFAAPARGLCLEEVYYT